MKDGRDIPDSTIVLIRKIRDEARRLETGHGYPMVSVRSLAEKLGLADRIDEILAACAMGGFDYCLDHTIQPANAHGVTGTREFPSRNVCYWGPDQLRSRLDCVDSRVWRDNWTYEPDEETGLAGHPDGNGERW